MPDPVWTLQYLYNQSPEQNGFTRQLCYQTPAPVTEVSSGPPANRRVEIDATDPTSGIVFMTSQIPALDSGVGVTAEMMLNVSGAADGDAGVELTFLDYAILLNICPNKIDLSAPAEGGGGLRQIIATSPNNVDTLWRLLFYPNHNVSVYRAGVLVAGPFLAPVQPKRFQRVLWWGEAGALSVWKAMRYYIGGAVEP